ncbi:hypothetical protein D9M73_249110 [compost metagenome]
MGRTNDGIVPWGQRLVIDRRPEVGGVIVGNHFARVLVVRKVGFDKREQRLPVGASHFNHLAGRCLHGYLRQCCRHIGRSDRLQRGRSQPNGVALGTGMGDGAHELEELGGTQNAVRHS